MHGTRAAEALSALTEADFDEEVLGSSTPVLVYFWAEWCPACRMVAPVLAEVARERADTLTVRTINADENALATRDYGVMSLPTLLFYRGGVVVQTVVGARPKARLLREIDAALEAPAG